MRRRPSADILPDQMERTMVKNQHRRIWCLVSISALFWFLLIYFHFFVLWRNPVRFGDSTPISEKRTKIHDEEGNDNAVRLDPTIAEKTAAAGSSAVLHSEIEKANRSFRVIRVPLNTTATEEGGDHCRGRYIYVHRLPSRFNEDMLKECKALSLWTNMCKFIDNAGMGPPLENVKGIFSNTGWYATNQFAVDVIFNKRMKQYDCLTDNSSTAAAVFVPFYAGFDIARYLWGSNTTVRDSAAIDLMNWLMSRPEWKSMGGRDHFLVAGRITWDFRRLTDEESDWGSKLLFLPAMKNMSMLVVESSPWNSNDFAIPYPTYLHPSRDAEVSDWQNRMRKMKRPWLFSFAGAPRPENSKSIRPEIIEECRKSEKCKLLECAIGESECLWPSTIMGMFQGSVFCLQPQGDSYTRRSAFDSMLAGCVPVFFHPASAYTQYTWHLPRNYSTYSVFITEDEVRKGNGGSIERRLSQIPPERVQEMREVVVDLIPRLVYADPRSKKTTFSDAFDVAVDAVIRRVENLRKPPAAEDFPEENSWKYVLLGDGERSVGPHEWDPYFTKPIDSPSSSPSYP